MSNINMCECCYNDDSLVSIPDTQEIIIQCWTGATLYEGSYTSKCVDVVLDANRCNGKHDDLSVCEICNDTGYSGDFEIYWKSDDDKILDLNVYEYINY